MRFDEDGALEKLTDATELLVYEFDIALETTFVGASQLNEENEIYNGSIQNMVR